MNIKRLKTRLFLIYRRSLPGRILRKTNLDRVFSRAAGLAFTTLMALVPIITVVLSFGGYESIESSLKNFLVEALLPASQEQILGSLNEFAQNSRRLGTFGLFISLVIIVLLLNNIEGTFNQILRSRPSKNFLVRFSRYTATLVFGIMLIGTSLTRTGKLAVYMQNLLGTSSWVHSHIWAAFFSFIMISFGLVLMYFLIPSCQMRLKSVFIGAAIGGFAWELAKQIFALWTKYSVRHSVIYGSLFLVPLLFIWVQVAWIIILTGLEITYVHQHRKIPEGSDRAIAYPRERIGHSLEMYLFVCQRFRNRQSPPRLSDLCIFLQLNEDNVLTLMTPFLKRRLIYITGEGDPAYLPGGDLRKISLNEVMNTIYRGDRVPNDWRMSGGEELWRRLDQSMEEALKGQSIEEILTGEERRILPRK